VDLVKLPSLKNPYSWSFKSPELLGHIWHYELRFGEEHSDYTVYLTHAEVLELISKLTDKKDELEAWATTSPVPLEPTIPDPIALDRKEERRISDPLAIDKEEESEL
jgi:hypothetical protein